MLTAQIRSSKHLLILFVFFFLLHQILFRINEVKSFSFLSFVNYLIESKVQYHVKYIDTDIDR